VEENVERGGGRTREKDVAGREERGGKNHIVKDVQHITKHQLNVCGGGGGGVGGGGGLGETCQKKPHL